MPAQQFDFVESACDGSQCEQGATFYWELVWEREFPQDSGLYVPVDITLYSAKMQVKAKLATDPVIVGLSTSNGRISFDGPNGFIKLSIDAATTKTLPAGFFKYDLDLTDSVGFVTRLIEGIFEIKAEITT